VIIAEIIYYDSDHQPSLFETTARQADRMLHYLQIMLFEKNVESPSH